MRRITILTVLLILVSASLVSAQVCPFATTEGNLLSLHAEGYDPDPEIGPAGRLIWTYSAPFNMDGLWQTRIGDAGVYHLTIGLSDGEYSDSYKACLEVFPYMSPDSSKRTVPEYNNPPMIFGLRDTKMYVGETLELHITCVDIDDNDVDITYYGWPGELVHTATLAEAGTHTAEVVCRDARGAEARQSVTYQVIPRSSSPAVTLDRIVVYEGEVIDLVDYVYDMDTPLENLRFQATGVFEHSLVWYTMKGDAGTYYTTLSVSDGQTLIVNEIEVVVLERPPELMEIRYSSLPEKEDVPIEVVAAKDPCAPKEVVPVVYSTPAKPEDIDLRMPAVKEEDPCPVCAPCEPDYEVVVVPEPDYPVELYPFNMVEEEEPCGSAVVEEETWSMSTPENECTNYIV